MGAQFALDIEEMPDLEAAQTRLLEEGYAPLWLSTPRGGTNCYSADFAMAGAVLVIGSEAEGVASVAGARQVTIPMPGNAESLNAAQAATLLLFEAVRRGVVPHAEPPGGLVEPLAGTAPPMAREDARAPASRPQTPSLARERPREPEPSAGPGHGSGTAA